MKTSKGFTLVEIVMVVVLIGVISAAAFIFLRGGLSAADSASEHSVEASRVQLAASEIESLLENAGYPGDLFRIDEPVLEASSERFSFFANTTNPRESGLEDEITIANNDGSVTVTDGFGTNLVSPLGNAEIAFAYTNSAGESIVDAASVRNVSFTITLDSGMEYRGYSSPYNLELAGLSPEDYREIYVAMDGNPNRWTEYKFQEDFETHPGYVFEDNMEGDFVWEPVIQEDFESAASWANNWDGWISDPGFGRIQRLNDASLAYEANNCLVLDCWKTGISTNMAIWTVDLSDYTDTDMRLRFHWREANDQLHYEDGVFLPTFTAGDTTEIDIEGFSDFRNGFNKGWTYWTNDYGRIVVTQDFATDGNYLNMDSRRNGSANECRIMNTYDLSAYSGSSNVWLRYDFASRDDENSAGDFIGIMGGSIQDDPLAQVALTPASFPNGSWITRTVDLDDLAPSGYDWSDFRIVFAQEDNDPTTSASGLDGISIDNVTVIETVADAWDLSNRMLQAPSNFQAWEEGLIDLTAEAASAGIPFSNDFNIGFSATNTDPFDLDGILFDAIYIDARNFGMAGWTHGVWPGYTEDEWLAVDNNADAKEGDWYYSVGGTTNYNTTPTNAWLQSPEIDLSTFSDGDRVAFAFFHKYDFGNAGGGCNIMISDDNGATWDVIAPYFGYYTSAVASLGGQPGWTGQNYGWGTTGPDSYDFAVFDITEYAAASSVRIRFNYGTYGESHGGWQVDYCRSRGGADWPQVDMNGGGFDWFAYSNSGNPDPSSTPNGSYWAGNDMSTSGAWDREYENNQNNYLLSPPVCFDNDTGAGIYSYLEFIASPRTRSSDYAILEVAAFSPVAPPSWHTIFSASGISPSFQQFRYRIDWLPPDLVWTDNKTVVFRWRMYSNGSSTAGGWNLDNIECFTSEQVLPDMFNGSPVLLDYDDTETDDLHIVDPLLVRESYTTRRESVRALYAPGPQRLLEDR